MKSLHVLGSYQLGGADQFYVRLPAALVPAYSRLFQHLHARQGSAP